MALATSCFGDIGNGLVNAVFLVCLAVDTLWSLTVTLDLGYSISPAGTRLPYEGGREGELG
jgi:hypothetical protein